MAAQFPSFESRTITIDGVNIHYVCGGSGPPLVLVHGLGSSAAVEFYYNLEPLAAHHRVLAIDLPGFGKSDKPMLKYTIDLFVKAVRDLMACEGLERAADVPLEAATAAARALALLPEVSKRAWDMTASDLAVGSELLETGLAGALGNVAVNLPELQGEAATRIERAYLALRARQAH